MMIRRRTTMRWGYRLGTSVAYFTDPELGAERRRALLDRLESIGGRTRFGPLIAWLQELNEGRLGPPPSRESFEGAGQPSAEAPSQDEPARDEETASSGGASRREGSRQEGADGDDEAATIDDLTIIEHEHQHQA